MLAGSRQVGGAAQANRGPQAAQGWEELEPRGRRADGEGGSTPRASLALLCLRVLAVWGLLVHSSRLYFGGWRGGEPGALLPDTFTDLKT